MWRLAAVVAPVGLAALLAAVSGARTAERSLLEHEAVNQALIWAGYLAGYDSDVRAVLHGAEPSAVLRRVLRAALQAGHVYRYKLFDPAGRVVLASRSSDIGRQTAERYFFETVTRGRPFAKLAERSDRAPAGTLAGEAYVPLIQDGQFAGAFEVYVDMSERRALLRYYVDRALQGTCVLVFAIIVAVFVAARRGLRNMARVQTLLMAETKAKTELADALRGSRDAARIAERAKSEFLAAMSHEIRTPMNGVLGLLELLLDTPLGERQREMLEGARRSAGHLLTVINDVLDISKLEAGRVELEHVAFDPNALLDDLLELLGPRAREKGLELRRVPGPPLPRVEGDPHRLNQVLTNLVGNAIKFTERGSIEVVARVDPSGLHEALDLAFEVRDTGTGIDPAGRDALFERFSQADSSTTRRYGGTGLGLAICKQLVELMDGRIALDPAPGGGTVASFRVRLREARGRAASAPYGASGSGEARLVGLRPLEVLVAEDNPINQRVARGFLESLGHRVTLAGDGEAALDAVRNSRFDVVLMDVQMPGMDGIEATRQIRALDKGTASVPVLALTADVLARTRDEALEAGMDGFVTKPVSKAGLVEALSRIGARGGTRRPEETEVPEPCAAGHGRRALHTR